MSVSFQDNTPQVLSTIQSRTALTQRLLLDGIHRRSTPITPRKRGELRSRVAKRVDGIRGTISWDAGHAVFQERGFSSGPIRSYSTPGTRAHFAEDSVKGELGNLGQYAKQAGLS